MYASHEARDADIDDLAGPPPSELAGPAARRHAPSSPTRSARCPRTGATPSSSARPAATDFPPPTSRAMRLREVEIHHADLDAGYDPADWPAEFAVACLDSMSSGAPPSRVRRARHRPDRELDLRPRTAAPPWCRARRRAGLVAHRPRRRRRTVRPTTATCRPWSLVSDDLHRSGHPGRPPRRPRAGPPDHHQGGGRPARCPTTATCCAAAPPASRCSIDAAAEPDTLLPLIGDAGLTAVVTTHQHWDHHRALADVVAATGADVVAGEPDADAITEQTGVAVTRASATATRSPSAAASSR